MVALRVRSSTKRFPSLVFPLKGETSREGRKWEGNCIKTCSGTVTHATLARRYHVQKFLELKTEFHYTATAFGDFCIKGSRIDAQVAQAVERSPEKAGVGGSTPSLGTIQTPSSKADSVPGHLQVWRGVESELCFRPFFIGKKIFKRRQNREETDSSLSLG